MIRVLVLATKDADLSIYRGILSDPALPYFNQ